MSAKFLAAAGTTLQLPNGEPLTLVSATLLNFTNQNSQQGVNESIASNVANFALNRTSFIAQTSISGISYSVTYGADAALIVGASVGPTPIVDVASSVRNTTTLTIVFSVAMDESITNKAGITVIGDGTTLTVNSISISGTTMTVTLSATSSATLMTISYVANQGTLASAVGALVQSTGTLVIAHS